MNRAKVLAATAVMSVIVAGVWWVYRPEVALGTGVEVVVAGSVAVDDGKLLVGTQEADVRSVNDKLTDAGVQYRNVNNRLMNAGVKRIDSEVKVVAAKQADDRLQERDYAVNHALRVTNPHQERENEVCKLRLASGSGMKQAADKLQQQDDVARLGLESGFEPQQASRGMSLTPLLEQTDATYKTQPKFDQIPIQDREEQERERKRRIRDMCLLFLPIPVIITRMKQKQNQSPDLQEGGNDKMMNNNGGNEFNMALIALLYAGSIPMFGPSAPLPIDAVNSATADDVLKVSAEACCGSKEVEVPSPKEPLLKVARTESTTVEKMKSSDQSPESPSKSLSPDRELVCVDSDASTEAEVEKNGAKLDVCVHRRFKSVWDCFGEWQKQGSQMQYSSSGQSMKVGPSRNFFIKYDSQKPQDVVKHMAQALSDDTGLKILWDNVNGIALVDINGVIEVVYNSYNDNFDSAKKMLQSTHNELKTCPITDVNGKLILPEGIQLLTPSHGHYSFDFMNPTATAGKCYACGRGGK